ncbi:hypothetical protein PFISCL1PPCAC_16742, partial [Pristionchus fissidentatus]
RQSESCRNRGSRRSQEAPGGGQWHRRQRGLHRFRSRLSKHGGRRIKCRFDHLQQRGSQAPSDDQWHRRQRQLHRFWRQLSQYGGLRIWQRL